MADEDGMQEAVFRALAQAEDSLSRLDESIRWAPHATGYLARADFSEAVAWAWENAELAPMEDLVLHDLGMDVRLPTQGLGRAHSMVRARRKAALGGGELVSVDGALWLAGRRAKPPDPSPRTSEIIARPPPLPVGALTAIKAAMAGLTRGHTEDMQGALGDWREAWRPLEGALPVLLVAVAALEAWRIAQPLPREDFVGPILVATWLRAQGRVGTHVLALQGGIRRRGRLAGALAAGPIGPRLVYWLEAMTAAGDLGLETLRDLRMSHRVLSRRAVAERSSSRASDLVDLILARPVVTAALVSKELRVTQQAARQLIARMCPHLRELSGRTRYQVWSL